MVEKNVVGFFIPGLVVDKCSYAVSQNKLVVQSRLKM